MALWKITVLALIQGACELLPVSSSAHVIMAEKLMGLDPAAPEMTFLLVMLHTGTMFAVIVYFWPQWRSHYFSSMHNLLDVSKQVVLATVYTGILGLFLMYFIERIILHGTAHAEVEQLFGNLFVIAAGLAAVGAMIIVSGNLPPGSRLIGNRDAAWIGLVQGLCLPIRGFSRSGATISTALFLGIEREHAEEFSFALAVVLTPAVILKEAYRLLKTQPDFLTSGNRVFEMVWPGLAGMIIAFIAGLGALQWLSRWLTGGHWKLFGIYCICAAAAVVSFAVHAS